MQLPKTTLITLCSLAMAAASLCAQELKLEDAIQLALQHNRQIANSKLDVARSSERLAAARTALFPSVRFTANASQQLLSSEFTIRRGELGEFPATGPIPSNDVTFSTPQQPTGTVTAKVTQPLSGIYKTRLNLKALDLSKQIDQEKARSTSQDVIRDAKRLYYEIQQKESSLTATREMVALCRELERLSKTYFLRQVALESDYIDAQTRVGRAEQDELALHNDQENLKEQLNQLMGRDVLTEFTVTPIAESAQIPVELAVARMRALDQRPEVRQAALKVQHAEQEIRVKRADYLPDVSADFSATRYLNFGSFLPSQSASVGVSLSWDPVDWGRRKHELAEKKYSADQSRNSEKEARDKVIMDVDSKYRKLREVQAQFRVARLSQKSALEQLRVAKRQYSVERVLLKDVLNVQTALEQANNDYQQSLARFLTARAEFEHAIGEDQ